MEGRQANTPPNIPDRRPYPLELSPAGGLFLLSWETPRHRPPGKAMVYEAMAAPASGNPEKASFSAVGARGDWASSPAARHGAQRGKVVFVDFGRGRVYALTADSDDVSEFDSLVEMVDRLSPAVVVVDSLPNNLQKTAAEIARTGIVFLRLKSLGKLSEERRVNGIEKTDRNDVRLLKTVYSQNPNLFQPLFTSPEELEVRALTEMWVELVGQRKAAKHARTTTDNPVAEEAHKTLRRLVDKLSKEIHEKALSLPLYRKAVQEMGLKGPILAYIISHDSVALTTLPRDRLDIRYDMTDRHWRGRQLRSRLLILLASSIVLHRHPRYRKIYEYYRRKGKEHWPAILRVAKRILRDLRQQTQRAGLPA